MAEDTAAKLTRAEQRELSRELILTAAINLFAERGFAGVTLDDVALASGAKRNLVLYYFKCKDELWRAAADDVAGRFNAAVRAKVTQVRDETEAERGRNTLGAWLDAFLEEPDLPRFLVREGGVSGPRLQYLIERFEYASVEFSSEALNKMLRSTILRDALMAIYLSMAALGPLMEASLSHVSGRANSGVYPMSPQNRRELVSLMARFISSAETETP